MAGAKAEGQGEAEGRVKVVASRICMRVSYSARTHANPIARAGKPPPSFHSFATRSFGRPVILAAVGLLGDLLVREVLVGRQRALDGQQPLQVLGQRKRQLKRAPSAALVRNGELDSGAPDVSDVNVSDCRRRARILASTRILRPLRAKLEHQRPAQVSFSFRVGLRG